MSTDSPPIYILSTGRSGSKLLHKAIAKSLYGDSVGATLNSFFVRDLGLWAGQCGQIIKSHCAFEPQSHDPAAKYIFLYTDVITTILSTVEQAYRDSNWWEEHQLNFGRKDVHLAPEQIFREDFLQLNRVHESWVTAAARHDNILVIRFEELFSNCEKISDFIGIQVPNQKKFPRKTAAIDVDVDINLLTEVYNFDP